MTRGAGALGVWGARHVGVGRAGWSAGGRSGGRAGRAGLAAEARHGRWACGLGALPANELCTWCTQPIFGPV